MSILECKGLSKRFGAVTALDGISFTIMRIFTRISSGSAARRCWTGWRSPPSSG